SCVAVWVMAPLSVLSSLDASVEQEANARAETASAVIATDLFMSPSFLTHRKISSLMDTWAGDWQKPLCCYAVNSFAHHPPCCKLWRLGLLLLQSSRVK